jgi:hypothetical protein
LHYSSAVVEIAPVANGSPVELVEEASQVFVDTVAALELGAGIDPRLDFKTISAFNGFSAVAKKRGTLLAIADTQLTVRFAASVKALLQADSSALGSMAGRLEAVSIHNENKFTLYPPVEGEEVDCVFPPHELQNVLRAIGRTVTVYGTLHYSKSKSFPIRVDVDSYDVMPEADELPTLLDMRGALKSPARAGNLREIRDEWT